MRPGGIKYEGILHAKWVLSSENGVLKLMEPLPFTEHEKVSVTVEPKTNWVQETAGILGWKGSPELAERFALDADLDYPPRPFPFSDL